MPDFDDVAIRLVADNDRAQKLAAAWPVVKRCRTKADFERWAAIALVPTSAARSIGPSLIAAGVCGPDGSLPEKVRQVIDAATVRHVMSPGMKRGAKRKQ